MRGIVERMEALLDRADGPGAFRRGSRHAQDRANKVAAPDPACPLWIMAICMATCSRWRQRSLIDGATSERGTSARILFLGDL